MYSQDTQDTIFSRMLEMFKSNSVKDEFSTKLSRIFPIQIRLLRLIM